MGIFSRFFAKDDDSPVTSRAVDLELRRGQLIELADALDDLRARMKDPGSPVNNPGWDGRVRDFGQASNQARMLGDRPVVTHDELFDYVSTVRPLFRGEPSAEYAHLRTENARVSVAIDAIIHG